MFRWTQSAGGLAGIAVLVGCALTPPRANQDAIGAGDPLPVLIAAVEGAVATRDGRPDVDPGLMQVPATGRRPSPADYRAVSPGLQAAFAAALEERGLGTARAFPLREGCSGLLVAPPVRRTDGCPAEPTSILAFDLPTRERGQPDWEVLMVEIGYTPRGYAVRVIEVRVREVGGQPWYAGETPLFFFE